MNCVRQLLVAAVTLVLAACGPWQTTPVALPDTQGTVIDGLSGEPLADIRVQATSTAGEPLPGAVTTTDGEGRFQLVRIDSPGRGERGPGHAAYMVHVPLVAEIPGSAVAYGRVSFVHPSARPVDGVILFALQDVTPLSDHPGLQDCRSSARQDYAYALSIAYPTIRRQDWFAELADKTARLDDRIIDFVRDELSIFSRACGLSPSDHDALMGEFAGISPGRPSWPRTTGTHV